MNANVARSLASGYAVEGAADRRSSRTSEAVSVIAPRGIAIRFRCVIERYPRGACSKLEVRALAPLRVAAEQTVELVPQVLLCAEREGELASALEDEALKAGKVETALDNRIEHRQHGLARVRAVPPTSPVFVGHRDSSSQASTASSSASASVLPRKRERPVFSRACRCVALQLVRGRRMSNSGRFSSSIRNIAQPCVLPLPRAPVPHAPNRKWA